LKARELHRNDLPAGVIAERAVRAVEAVGGVNDDWPYIVARAAAGWTAAEIARGYVRKHYCKGDIRRRRMLTALTKLGAGVAR
jgi:hypothetical protein